MSLNQAKNASTLVLYDWGNALPIPEWVKIAFEFFELVGASPNAIAYRRPNSKGRTASIKSLPKVKEQSDLCSIEIHELLEPKNDFGMFSCYAGFNIMGRKKTAVFSYDCSHIDADLFSAVVQKLADTIKITYGFAFIRKRSLGPVMFAYDLYYDRDGGRNHAEEKEIVLWKQERLDMVVQKKPALFRHLDGLLRDVYPLNVLAPSHLQRRIEDRTLKDWIIDAEWRGFLNEVSACVWLWTVLDSQLVRVQSALHQAGLLIAKPLTGC